MQQVPTLKNTFDSQTARRYAQLAPLGRFTSLGQTVTVPLAKSGYGSEVFAYLIGTITTGAGAAGNWSANFPYSLIDRVRLGGNDGNQLTDLYGVCIPDIAQRYQRGFDLRNAASPNNSAAVTAAGAPSGFAIFPAAGSAIAASTTYKFLIPITVPIGLWFDNQIGLAFLQSNQSTVNLDVTLANAGALTAGSLGTNPAISIDIKSQLEYFLVGTMAAPNQDFSVKRTTQQIAWTASGVQNYAVPVSSNKLVSLDMKFQNAGNPQPFFGTAGDPTSGLFDQMYYSYATTTVPERTDLIQYLHFHREKYGIDASDGVFKFDFGFGLEGVGNGTNTRDYVSEAELTDLLFSVGTSVVPGAGSTILCTRTELVPSARLQAMASGN